MPPITERKCNKQELRKERKTKQETRPVKVGTNRSQKDAVKGEMNRKKYRKR